MRLIKNNIALSTIDKEMLPTLRKWRNHPSVKRWCRQHNLINEINHQNWYEWQSKDKSLEMLSVIKDSDLIGVCGLTSIDYIHRRAEFSLYIGPEHQCKGHGKKALIELLSFGFNDLNLNLIWGESFNGNPALSMFESIGFCYEGTRRMFYYVDGEYLDAHLVSISKDEFNEYKLNSIGP